MDEIKKAEFAQLDSTPETEKLKEIDTKKITKLLDVILDATVELGRTKITIEDALGLDVGSVVELEKIAGEPVDFYINDNLFARGEVVVIDDKYGIRINELVGEISINEKKQKNE